MNFMLRWEHICHQPGTGLQFMGIDEMGYALNQADKFILAVCIVDWDVFEGPFYIPNPFQTETEFGIAGVNYDLGKLLLKAVPLEETL